MGRRLYRISSLLCWAAGAALSQDAGPPQPVVGDRWIYETEIRDGNGSNLHVARWTQEDTTFAIERLPEGTLIRRKVAFLNGSSPPDWIGTKPADESNILIHNSCLYYLGDSPSYGSGFGWDGRLRGLTADFRVALAAGTALPDVCFPLRVGRTWGYPEQPRSSWTVTGIGSKNRDDPVSAATEPNSTSWRLEAHLSSGDDNYVWFRQGPGVIAARTFHHGTYHDERIRLLRFDRAKSTGTALTDVPL